VSAGAWHRVVVIGVDEHGVDVKGSDGTVTRYPAQTYLGGVNLTAGQQRALGTAALFSKPTRSTH
jgi:hypothetical protein